MTRERLEAEAKIDAIRAGVKAELLRATVKHGPMRTPHEAFGVIYEEFNIEFAEAMKANDRAAQKLEMEQVAAMARRFLFDLC